MDARKLRDIDAASFAQRRTRGKSLDTALDDGFAPTERDDLIGHSLVLVAWEIKTGNGGSDYAQVWAIAEMKDGEYVKVKFQDGGRSYDGIPAKLKELTANGVRENVACTIGAQEYDFQDKDTMEWRNATRYYLVNVDEKDDDADPGF